MILYSYWRSTTSLRVRAALNLKGLSYETRSVNLLEGAQAAPAYTTLNPIGGVPTLVLDDGTVLTQSMAILDYLDEVHPTPSLLPDDPVARARMRAAAHALALDVHPINNLKVVKHFKGHGHSDAEGRAWMNHWCGLGFAAMQELVAPEGPYCFGQTVTQADLCLVGQMVNARRWGLDLAPFARLDRIDQSLRALPEIAAAMPEQQPDAKP